MPIAGYKPDEQLPTKPNLPQIQPKQYESVVVDDKYTPIKSLIAYVEGAPWTVDYYSQVVTKHNDLREIDPGSPSVYQQYQKIKQLEIRVSSALTDSYDTESGITTVTGNGLMYGTILPNVSDYFITDTGDAKKGIFRVNNVERKNFNRDSAFYIEYELVGFAEIIPDTYNDLEAKVIRTYYFNKDRLVDGLQPLVKEEDHQQIDGLRDNYLNLIKYYFKTFFNRKYMTLVLPGQNFGIYDSFLVDYLLKIVDSFDAEEIRLMKQLPTDFEVFLSQPQLWKAMYERDYDSLAHSNQHMGLVDKSHFNTSSWIRGMAYTNVDYVVYPISPDESSLVKEDPLVKTLSIEETIETKNVSGVLASMITLQYVEPAKTYQQIFPVLVDDYYVLSTNFYLNTVNQSLIEILTKDYLKRQSIDLKKLYALIGTYKTWSRLEQFYYTPILITLIKEADRSTYT